MAQSNPYYSVEVSYFKEPFSVTNATDDPTGLAGWMWSRDFGGSLIPTFDNLEYVIPFAIWDPCGKVLLCEVSNGSYHSASLNASISFPLGLPLPLNVKVVPLTP